ncbi:MAG: AraC family transcriptional regulator [Gammaproteobacteria bacterium]|nr:AraC family transcriptional regulator [Gammaproteobacteria bacterium]MCY4338994.1 AraC family transcriptional regulator [Gammaproteobacteria bacterium]
MLRSPQRRRRNIDAIAYQCGFNSLPYFYRKFRQRYGCSPRAYSLKNPAG